MDIVTAPTSGDPETDALVAGPVWAGSSLTFSFPTLASQFTGYSGGEPQANFEALNVTQQAAVRAILTSISTFTNLTFAEITGANAGTAVLRFGMSDAAEVAHAYLPSTDERGGDSWYNNAEGDYDAPVRGNYAWFTFLHEIGHAVGLGHPHEAEPPMAADRDVMPFTVMSYRSSTIGSFGYPNETWSYAQSYMVEDIAALQFLYGANFSYNNTDTVYRWNPASGEMSINGVGQGVGGGKRVFTTIWDGGGDDTYDLSNYAVFDSDGAVVDLRPGAYSTLPPSGQHSPILGGFIPGSIANALLVNGDARSLIEHAIGTGASDKLFGNDGRNRLDGGAGDDELHGFGGDDILIAGPGYGDLLYGGDGNDSLSGGGVLRGGDGDDTLQFAQRQFGEHGNDLLIGSDLGDDLRGDDGDDTLRGELGWDNLFGGDGRDRLEGGAGGDVLWGEAGDDVLFGGDDDDVLAGGAGNDVMRGGPGNDTYRDVDEGDVVIELDGEGNDSIEISRSIVLPDGLENAWLLGIGPADLTGNAADNILLANAGENKLDGSAGADTMYGYLGNDVYYVDHPDDLVFELSGDGEDTIHSAVSYTLRETTPPPPGYDPYAGASVHFWPGGTNAVERLILTGSASLTAIGNGWDNVLLGNSGANRLEGRDGSDTLAGGAGADELIGGAGADVFLYRSATESLSGQEDWLSDFQHGQDLVDLRQIATTTVSLEVLESGTASAWTRATVGTSAGPALVLRIAGVATLGDFLIQQGAPESHHYDPMALLTDSFGASAAAGGWVDYRNYPRMAADIDGDGQADLAGFGSGGVYAALTGSAGEAGPTYLAINGFGADVAAGGWIDDRNYPRTFGDIDGDGLADIVGFGSGGVYVSLATGNGQFGPVSLALAGFGADAAAGGWVDSRAYPRTTADINGDGLDDLVGFGGAGVYAALATGGGHFGAVFLAAAAFGRDAAAGGWSDDNLYPRLLADIDGDGDDDLIGFGVDGTFAALANGDGTFGEMYLAYERFGSSSAAGGWSSNDQYFRTAGDTNGDGLEDLIGFGQAGVFVALADGSGHFLPGEQVLGSFGTTPEAGGWTSQNAFPRTVADLDGDGAVDLIGFGDAGVFVAMSASDWIVV